MTAVLDKLVFVGDDPFEQYRAKTLWTKEPGTIQWLQENVREGDVFYDIGANIGCYTLVAAQLVGEKGHVFGFEPHVANAHSLLRNIMANGLSRRFTLVSSPLCASDVSSEFCYYRTEPGSSNSQFGVAEFAPAALEIKCGMRLDTFVWDRPDRFYPDLIKIDVDGLELAILRGGSKVLSGFLNEPSKAPRSVQVEMPPVDAESITALMQSHGYFKERIHYTSNGQQQIDKGVDPATVIHNAIFKKG
jgi:FkbM family methyltransferase